MELGLSSGRRSEARAADGQEVETQLPSEAPPERDFEGGRERGREKRRKG